MPLQWNIYYCCCIYYLLWGTWLAVALSMPGSPFNWFDAIVAGLLFVFVIAGKALLSLKFIKYYKNKSIYSSDERYLFIACFVLNIIIAATVAIAVYDEIYEALRNSPIFKMNEIGMLAATFLFVPASLYLIIFDLPLKSQIKKRHYTSINTIGQDTATQP